MVFAIIQDCLSYTSISQAYSVFCHVLNSRRMDLSLHSPLDLSHELPQVIYHESCHVKEFPAFLEPLTCL